MPTHARPLTFLALLACAFIAPTQASDQDAARHRIGVPKLQGRADVPTKEQDSPALPQAQEGLKATQALMAQIHRTSDPAERNKLLQQHLQAMNANLAQLRGLIGSEMSERQMAHRMDLMQAMLDQMSERQKLEESSASRN
jgi:hypothetical protein